MNVSTFLTQVNYALRGIDDDTPTVGTDEANYWVETLNRKINELYRNSRVLWDATWSEQSLGAVSASATPSYNCAATLIAPSDEVRILDSNSKNVYYEIIKPRQRLAPGRYFYLSGNNPQVLHCTNEITATEDIVGGTAYLPGYYMPADVDASDGTDTIPLDDPYWGVMATAAEIAYGDITYEDKVEGLNAKANELYRFMVRNNRKNSYGSAKRPAHDHYRIKNTENK